MAPLIARFGSGRELFDTIVQERKMVLWVQLALQEEVSKILTHKIGEVLRNARREQV